MTSRKPEQLGRADLAQMTPEQVSAARKAGQLDDVLGVRSAFYPPPDGTQWTPVDLNEASTAGAHRTIAAARARGDLDDLMKGKHQ